MTSVSELKVLLAGTTMEEDDVDELLQEASALWLLSAPPAVLAGDLALCNTPLGAEEVRASAQPLTDGSFRITVVAHDRPGLLADAAGALTAERLSIVAASVMTWKGRALAIQSLTVTGRDLEEELWERLCVRLRGLGTREHPVVHFRPHGRAVVSWTTPAMGRLVLTVRAPDQIGLLWAICDWLAANGASIEAAHVGGASGIAEDQFVIVGEPDLAGLAERLTGPDADLAGRAGCAMGSLWRLVGRRSS
jgi:UTP:GlnB (protein PII) uridylyltransferase